MISQKWIDRQVKKAEKTATAARAAALAGDPLRAQLLRRKFDLLWDDIFEKYDAQPAVAELAGEHEQAARIPVTA